MAKIYRVTMEKMLDELRSGRLIRRRRDEDSDHGRERLCLGLLGDGDSRLPVSPDTRGNLPARNDRDFAGVLVSDFYAAYDSVKCPQQKCHLHLMRDINDDLLQHPFDEELKELARRYTRTLKPIIDTIDKHGCCKSVLAKHQRDAQAFLDWVAGEVLIGDRQGIQDPDREVRRPVIHVLGLRRGSVEQQLCRERHQARGVSQTAIRDFGLGAGLKDYLVFLSIYQTLRRKGLSLLRFLLSGEIDLERFVASQGRR